MPFKGKKYAIEYFRHHEPELLEAIDRFYATIVLVRQVEIAQAISEQILTPLGGLWRSEEVLAFGDEKHKGLQAAGYEVFGRLFEHKRR